MPVNRTNLGEVNFTAETKVEKSVVIKQYLDSTWTFFEVVIIKHIYYVVFTKGTSLFLVSNYVRSYLARCKECRPYLKYKKIKLS